MLVVVDTIMTKISYPNVRRDENKIDDYHGTKVANPYHWLEDPDSEETKNFVEEQNKISDAIIEDCPLRNQFKER